LGQTDWQLEPPLESSSIDVLLYGDVLEHLIDPLAVLRRHRRFLGPNGQVLASIPKGLAAKRVCIFSPYGLAQYAAVCTRSCAANSTDARIRTKSCNDQLQQEVALLRAELHIKDARMAVLPPPRRPHYPPVERLESLQLRAARRWSLQQTADTFLVTAATIASWMNRLEESGPTTLVQLRTPVNKFPDFLSSNIHRARLG
jgi:hypothetical protein